MGKRIISQNRGKGTPTYRAPPHRRKEGLIHPGLYDGKTMKGEIIKIAHDPARSAPIASAVFEEENKREEKMILVPEGVFVGQKIAYGEGAPLEVGNTLPILNIPEGTLICNIESKLGDGGKFARASGVYGAIISHERGKTIVRLPSGGTKKLDSKCRATIGIVAGGGKGMKPFLKAGKKYNALKSKAQKYPKVSAVKMNSVDHPYGGGGHKHIGRQKSVSRGTPPGRKVGSISPRRTGRGR